MTNGARTTTEWNPLSRIVFRFVVAYFGLFCLLFAQITFVFTGLAGKWLPDGAIMWQMRTVTPLTDWLGGKVFGVDAVLHEDSGSGDQASIWLLIFGLLLAAAVITIVWSVLDRRRRQYVTFGSWFLAAMRLCLGGQMLWYGIFKLIPTQMPSPALTTLLTDYGDFTPMMVLWNQVGSSHHYEMALGAAEVVGGLLLFLPRTATGGALLSMICMAQVFLLNMTFDVPVKILSLHLLLLSLVVLAPQARRLANVLVLEKDSEPATQPALFATPRRNRISATLQVALGIWILLGAVQIAWQGWREWGDGAPKPELYGIWTVTEFTMDGLPVPPLTTDPIRWQRLVVDTNDTSYQLMDDTFVPTVATVDTNADTITLTEPASTPDAEPTEIATFTVVRPTPGEMTLTGQLNGRDVMVVLQEFDIDSFPQRSRGFNWVQEYA
ncbi:DoxX family protein [Antrihabitans sp. NCIMB 15449]|uniref:DoxX family protein n=1 Tax=Antrihabitans spumae TaxID=3373370 RepID=A0ABW7JQI2_9NOCA